MTIRQMLEDYRNEIAAGLEYQQAADILTKLAALYGNINDEILMRDMEYRKVLLGFLDTEEKANRAKIRAEISPEYEAMRQAHNAKDLLEELMRSLKYWLRSREDEYQAGKFQKG